MIGETRAEVPTVGADVHVMHAPRSIVRFVARTRMLVMRTYCDELHAREERICEAESTPIDGNADGGWIMPLT